MNVAAALIEPLFTHDGRHWLPHAEAGGPFGGLHGGAVSGLVVAEMEREAREQGMGLALGGSVLLIRPAPMAPLEMRTEILRKGGRVGVLETSLLAGGKLIAKGTASFVTAAPFDDVPAATPRPFDPASLPAWARRPRFAHATLFDAEDIRDDGRGTKWARLIRPLMGFATPFANLFAIADNGTPFYLTTHRPAPPRYGFPNIDITIHVSRAPIGDWIGVTAQSDWRPEGRGLTESALYDEHGPLGRACQIVVLTERAPS